MVTTIAKTMPSGLNKISSSKYQLTRTSISLSSPCSIVCFVFYDILKSFNLPVHIHYQS
uniref:Uncharacterized protein n=1 Tax=Anguilla anguilla TaxID=7936 RepID=A0A0E9WQ78_ANGAN